MNTKTTLVARIEISKTKADFTRIGVQFLFCNGKPNEVDPFDEIVIGAPSVAAYKKGLKNLSLQSNFSNSDCMNGVFTLPWGSLIQTTSHSMPLEDANLFVKAGNKIKASLDAAQVSRPEHHFSFKEKLQIALDTIDVDYVWFEDFSVKNNEPRYKIYTLDQLNYLLDGAFKMIQDDLAK